MSQAAVKRVDKNGESHAAHRGCQRRGLSELPHAQFGKRYVQRERQATQHEHPSQAGIVAANNGIGQKPGERSGSQQSDQG